MSHKLDKKNERILSELDQNSRQLTSQLAKKVGLSKQSTHYRIDRLKEQGIIKQFYTLVNFTALGYKPYKIFLRMNNLTKKEIETYLEEFRKMEYVVWTVHCDGRFDIILGMIAKNTEHFQELYLSVLERYSKDILQSDHSVILSAHQGKKKYLGKVKTKPKINEFYVDQKESTIDKRDAEILKMVSVDAKKQIVEIAKKLNVTAEATRTRIKNLEKRSIIMGSSILVDTNKLGYLSYKVLLELKKKSKQNVNTLVQFLNSHPLINEVINVLGNWDLEIDLEVKSVKEFNEIITQIRNKFKEIILGYETLIKYEEHSYNYYPVR